MFEKIKKTFQGFLFDETDGLKIDFEQGWVHLRLSNTEPVMRIYAEAPSPQLADEFATRIMREISQWSC